MTKKPRTSDKTSKDEIKADAADSAATDAVLDAEAEDDTEGDGIESDTAESKTSAAEAVTDAKDTEESEGTEEKAAKADAAEPAEASVAGALPAQGAERAEVLPAVAPAPPAASGPGAGALILGGVIAGAIGFSAAWFMPQPEVAPAIDPALEDRVAAIEAEVSGFETPAPFDPSGLEARQDDFGSQIDALSASIEENLGQITARIDEMSGQVDELAARPVFEAGDTEAAMNEQIAAFEQIVADAGAEARAELDRLRGEAETLRAEAETMQAEAIAATEAADRRAAAASIQAAIDSGATFEEEVATLDQVPGALAELAATGVPTLTELRQGFPEAARAALATAASEPSAEDSGGMSRVTSFLRRQTNARSLAPKDGGSVDAILSRAEAALNDGDLPATLEELQALPEEAGTAMSDWLDQARTRAAAVVAAQELVEG